MVAWSIVLSATDLCTRRIPTPLVWWCAAGLVISALAGGPPVMARVAVGASVLSGLLRLVRGLGVRSRDGAGTAIGGGDIRLGVTLGLFVGWSASSFVGAVVDPLLVAGLASFLALFVVAFRVLVTGWGSWREPLAFGSWLCLAALVIGI
jgi:Flp pilus assembly protein protease CpaA